MFFRHLASLHRTSSDSEAAGTASQSLLLTPDSPKNLLDDWRGLLIVGQTDEAAEQRFAGERLYGSVGKLNTARQYRPRIQRLARTSARSRHRSVDFPPRAVEGNLRQLLGRNLTAAHNLRRPRRVSARKFAADTIPYLSRIDCARS